MGKRVGGRGWNAPAKKSRENHESKPLIRVAAGSIGPTNADRWVSMETRICPLGPYVPASSRLSVVGVSATTKSRGTRERERKRGPSLSVAPLRLSVSARVSAKEAIGRGKRGRNKPRGRLQNGRGIGNEAWKRFAFLSRTVRFRREPKRGWWWWFRRGQR